MKSLTIKKEWIGLRLISVVLLLFGMFLVQDLIESVLKNFNFYLSEAALFNVFWLLFFPGILFSKWSHQRLAWEGNSNHFQTTLIISVTAGLHLTLFIFCVHGGSRLFFDHVYGLNWTLRYTLAEHLFPAVIGYVFIALAGVVRDEQRLVGNKFTLSPFPVFAKRLAVKNNLQTIYLDVKEIACLSAESPYVAVHAQERKYLKDTTLKALATQLSPGQFVRIHRSCIINLSWVSSTISRGNGDYDVVLRDESTHRLSRNYAAEYKRRMATHQLTQ